MAQEDIIFYLDADGSAAINAINAIIESIAQLQAAIDALGNATNLDTLTAAFDAISQALDRTAQSSTTLDDSLTAVKDTADTTSQAVDTVTQSTTALDDKITTTADETQQFIANVQELQDMLHAFSGDVQAITEIMQMLSEAEQQAIASGIDLDSAYAQMSATGQQAADTTTQVATAQTAVKEAVDATTAAVTTQVDAITAATQGFNFYEATLNLDALANSDATSATTGQIDVMAGLQEILATVSTAYDSVISKIQEYAGAQAEATVAAEEAAPAMEKPASMFGPDSINLIILTSAMFNAAKAFSQMGIAAQDSIAHVIGLADPTLAEASHAQELQTVIAGVEQECQKFGVSMKDAADGLYYIMSSGFNVSDSLKILSYSMEAASATGAKMDTISNGLTSILKDYNLKASDAGTITNQMVEAAVQGKQTFQDFSNSIGPTASVAARAGVSFAEVAAAEATMTEHSSRVRQDTQNLSHLMETLAFKVDTVANNAQSLGLNFDKTKFQSMDLIDRLKYLSSIAGGDTTEAFNKLLTDQTSARAAFMLLSGGASDYTRILGDVLHNTNALSVAFQASEATITASIDHIKATLSVLSYQMVVLATPIVKQALDALDQVLQYLSAHIEILKPVLIGLASIFGGILVLSIGSLVGFLLGILGAAGGVAIALGALAGVAAYLAPHFAAIGAAVTHLFPGLKNLEAGFHTFASFVATTFNSAVQAGGKALQQFGAWASVNVVPALREIVNNLLTTAGTILSNVGPAVHLLAQFFAPVASAIQTYVLPGLRQLVAAALQFGVAASGHIIPILATIGQGFMAVLTYIRPFAVFIISNILPSLLQFATQAARVGSSIISNLAPALHNLTPVLSLLITGISPVIARFALMAVSIGRQVIPPILSMVKAIGPVISSLGRFALSWNGILSILSSINPVFLLVAAAIAIVGALILNLWNNSAFFRAAIQALVLTFLNLWNVLVSALQPVFSNIVQVVQGQLVPAWQHLLTALAPLQPVWMVLGAIIGGVIVTAIGVLIGVIAGLITAIGQILVGLVHVIGGIIQIFSGVVQVVVSIFGLIIGAFTHNDAMVKSSWSNLWTGVADIFSGIGQVIYGLVQGVLGAILGFIWGFVGTIINFFQHLADTLVGHSIIPDMINAIVAVFLTFIMNIINRVVTFVNMIIAYFNMFRSEGLSIWQALTQAIYNAVMQLAIQVLAHVIQFVANLLSQFHVLVTTAQSIWNQLPGIFVAVLSNIANLASTWGAHIIDNLVGAIKAGIGAVSNAVGAVGNAIASVLHHSKPDTGPLKDDDVWMIDFVDSMVQQLEGQTGKVKTAATKIATSISLAAPNSSDLAGMAAPSGQNTQTVQVLMAILQELQAQGKANQQNNNPMGHSLTSTNIGSVLQQFNAGGLNNLSGLYQELNRMGGLAVEYADRGANNGLGI